MAIKYIHLINQIINPITNPITNHIIDHVSRTTICGKRLVRLRYMNDVRWSSGLYLHGTRLSNLASSSWHPQLTICR